MAKFGGAALSVEPDVEEAGHEGGPISLVDALEQAGQARVGRVALDELLVIEELVAQRRERVEGQIQEPATLEVRRGPGGR